HFVNNYGLVAIGFMEAVVIAHVFGTVRFREYVNRHSEVKIGIWWDVFIKWVIPILLGGIMIWSLIEEIRRPYENYPHWALFFGGWTVVLGILNVGVLLMDRKAFLKISLPISAVLMLLLTKWLSATWVMFILTFTVLYGGLALSLYVAHKKQRVWLDGEDE
ncbi:MAG: hypothetical protein V1800_11565, partial [Candidatus Latescibacterota bacterium]